MFRYFGRYTTMLGGIHKGRPADPPEGEGFGKSGQNRTWRGEGGLRCSDVRNWKNYIRSFLVIFVGNHICVRKFLLPGNCEYVIMCLSAYTCSCSDFHTMGNQKVGRPTGEGGASFRTTPDRRGRGVWKSRFWPDVLYECPLSNSRNFSLRPEESSCLYKNVYHHDVVFTALFIPFPLSYAVHKFKWNPCRVGQ